MRNEHKTEKIVSHFLIRGTFCTKIISAFFLLAGIQENWQDVRFCKLSANVLF